VKARDADSVCHAQDVAAIALPRENLRVIEDRVAGVCTAIKFLSSRVTNFVTVDQNQACFQLSSR
jgi:hypothetical protein